MLGLKWNQSLFNPIFYFLYFHSHHFCLLAPKVTSQAGPCRKEEDSRVFSSLLDSVNWLDLKLMLNTKKNSNETAQYFKINVNDFFLTFKWFYVKTQSIIIVNNNSYPSVISHKSLSLINWQSLLLCISLTICRITPFLYVFLFKGSAFGLSCLCGCFFLYIKQLGKVFLLCVTVFCWHNTHTHT